MFDFNAVRSRGEFSYWFKRIGVTNTWEVLSNDDVHEHIAMLDEYSTEQNPDIFEEFSMFKSTRPEYYIGKQISEELIKDPTSNVALYETLIVGSLLLQFNNDEISFKYAERALQWLHSTDFFTAPASTRYHESEPCGLLHHTLRTADKAMELCNLPSWSMICPHEAILAALCHDWCKIGLYEEYTRNVKNEQTGVWEQKSAYRRKEPNFPYGHGTGSMIRAIKCFKLTTEQELAINWHMGAYYTHGAEMDDLNRAVTKYPMVLLIQTADMLAINRWGTDEEYISAADYKSSR